MSGGRRLLLPGVVAAALPLLSCLASCEGVVNTAVAPPPALPQENVEVLCHPSATTPCLLRVGGTLHDASSGAPLSGKRLRFIVGDAPICTSTTDASGHASCVGVVPSVQGIADSGYSIVFDGDGRFPPTRTKGHVVVHPPKP